MDTLNSISIRRSNTFNKNEALAKVIVEDDDLYGELRSRLRASKLWTNMGAGEALNSTIMRSMEQCVYMKYPELEQELSRQEEECIQGSYRCPASGEHHTGGIAAAIASSFQSFMVRIGNENSNTKNTASSGSGPVVTRVDSAFVGRRVNLMQTTSTPMAARNRAAASSRRRGSLAGSFLDAFVIVEDVKVEEEQPPFYIDPRKLNLRRADSYAMPLPPTSSSSLPNALCRSLGDQPSWVTSTASQIIGGALSRIRSASFAVPLRPTSSSSLPNALCRSLGDQPSWVTSAAPHIRGASLSGIGASVEKDVMIPHQAAATQMEQHVEPPSQQQSVLVASEVNQTTSECDFDAWDNDEECTTKIMF
jgi:hypothetical protein